VKLMANDEGDGMTEPTEAKPKEFIPKDVLNNLVAEITSQLNEPARVLIRRIVIVIGVERAKALLQQTLDIEAAGGKMTLDGTRRKTPGGVFISLARAQAASAKERKRMLDPHQPPKPVTPAAPDIAESSTPAPPQENVAPPALTWEEAKQFVTQALQSIGEAKTVKLTLIGRPSKVVQQQTCVVVAMKGKEPPSLPKGLPTPPANSAITWAVFIANKQWNAVKDSIIGNPEDNLIVEGYPIIDPKSSASVVLVTSCKSVMQERAQREAKKGSE
jgi:hypothetical protein